MYLDFKESCDLCLRIYTVSDLGKYLMKSIPFAFESVCHLHLHYCMMGGNLTGTELLYIVYLKNSMKIMRVGRWELKSSRISILQFAQKDSLIKHRGISRMPNFLSKQNRPVGLFRLVVCCQLPSDMSNSINSDKLWNLTSVWIEWERR